MTQTQRIGILVLGMHRSGTSALTRVLNLLGCDLPKSLMRPTEDNEVGYWESEKIFWLNERILKSTGSRWDDWKDLAPQWRVPGASQFLQEATELIKDEFGRSRLFVLKDPRICRFADFWIGALRETGIEPFVVLPLRNPLEVAASLERRDGLSLPFGHLLWLRHVLDAEFGSRGVRRFFTSYDQLMMNWRDVAKNLQATLETELPAPSDQTAQKIDSFLSRKYRHHKKPISSVIESPELAAWLRDSTAILERWAANGEKLEDIETLNRIRIEFNRAGPAFGPYVAKLEAACQEAQTEKTAVVASLRREADVEKAEAVAAVRRQADAEKAAAIASLRREADAKKAEAVAAVRRQAETDKATALGAVRETAYAEVSLLRSQMDASRSKNDALRSTLSWRLSAPLRTIERFPIVLSRFLQRHRMRRRRQRDYETLKSSNWFNEEWYLNTYPDVAEAGVDSVFHYIRYGAAEGRAPGPTFDTIWYLKQNPDVRSERTNPLVHYLRHGAAEGRQPTAHHSPTNNYKFLSQILSPDEISWLHAAQATQPQSANMADSPELNIKVIFRQIFKKRLSNFIASSKRIAFPESDNPELSIILVLHNSAELTLQCLESIHRHVENTYEIIIVDNASTDETRTLIDRCKGIEKFLNESNEHFIKGVNRAAVVARGKYILLLNSDAILTPGAVKIAADTISKDCTIGCVGAKIVMLDGRLQEAGCVSWRDGSSQGVGRGAKKSVAQFRYQRDVDFCSGVFLLISRNLFETLGGLDTAFAPAYYDDADICARIWGKGLRVVYEPRAEVIHFEYGSSPNASGPIQLMKRNAEIFLRKHADYLRRQPDRDQANLEIASRLKQPQPRVLLVEDAIPDPRFGAGLPRSKAILDEFVRQGASVTVYAFQNGPVDLDQCYFSIDIKVEILTTQDFSSLGELLSCRMEYYDVIFVSRPHNMERFRSYILDNSGYYCMKSKIIYDAEALFSKREEKKAQIVGDKSYASGESLKKEIQLADIADMITAVSSEEKAALDRYYPGKTLRLGHVLEVKPSPNRFGERSDFLFVGRLIEDESPNVDSIVWFCREVMPLIDDQMGKDWHLWIIGEASSERIQSIKSDRVRVVGQVDVLEEWFDRSRVFVAPTRFAAGVPHKLHHAASRGLPSVGTKLLLDQLGWSNGAEMLAAETPREFATACVKLYTEEKLWIEIRRSAIEAVSKDCDPAMFSAAVRSVLNVTDLDREAR